MVKSSTSIILEPATSLTLFKSQRKICFKVVEMRVPVIRAVTPSGNGECKTHSLSKARCDHAVSTCAESRVSYLNGARPKVLQKNNEDSICKSLEESHVVEHHINSVLYRIL